MAGFDFPSSCPSRTCGSSWVESHQTPWIPRDPIIDASNSIPGRSFSSLESAAGITCAVSKEFYDFQGQRRPVHSIILDPAGSIFCPFEPLRPRFFQVPTFQRSAVGTSVSNALKNRASRGVIRLLFAIDSWILALRQKISCFEVT